MNRQSPQDEQAAIDAIASQRLVANPQAQQQPQQPPQADPNPTQQERAMEKGSPKTEGDAQLEEAMIALDVGNGQKRELSQSQVKGMLDRYRDLNFKNMQNKPLLDAASKFMQANNMSPDDFINNMGAIMQKAQEKGTTFGGEDEHPNRQTPPPNQGADPDFDAKLKAWEDENAASLPPMYKDMLMQNQMLNAGMRELHGMMQHLMGAQSGQTRAAQEAFQQAGAQQQANMRDMIGMNLNRVQQQFGFPDDTAQAFMEFAGERGYLLEDFVDPNLTMKVAQDFANAANSGELQRLQDVARRRQAYTGAQDPTASGAGAPPQQGDNSLDQLTDFIKNRR